MSVCVKMCVKCVLGCEHACTCTMSIDRRSLFNFCRLSSYSFVLPYMYVKWAMCDVSVMQVIATYVQVCAYWFWKPEKNQW